MAEGGRLAEDSSIRRSLNQQLRRGNAPSYEDHYATLPRALTTAHRGNVIRSMVLPIFLLLGDRLRRVAFSQPAIYFLPKSRASIDQAPGPIIANVPPSAAKMVAKDSSAAPVRAIHTCTTATSAPTAGVHNPARINNPKTLPINSGTDRPAAGTLASRAVPW
jgi:hypothetical protein